MFRVSKKCGMAGAMVFNQDEEQEDKDNEDNEK